MTEPIKLLLAEDSAREREALRKQLSQSGVNATLVGETRVGPETVTGAGELEPDIILLSLEEPLITPLRILESLTIGGTPVIVFSSIGHSECLRKAMRAGAREYLLKPFSAEELGKTIDGIFKAEQQRKALLSTGEATVQAQGEIISICSAKGGTGKTTLASNLAVALASTTGHRVALVDLNQEQGDVAIMLDIVPRKTIADLAQIADRLEMDMVKASCLTIEGARSRCWQPERSWNLGS